jgi:ATP-binding cassette subfamily B protein
MAKQPGREKYITRQVHRLFWQANWQSKGNLIIAYLTRVPAVALYNTFIPLVSAYAIQAIITRRFSAVGMYAWWVVGLSVGYCVLWAIGGTTIAKQAVLGSTYIQNKVFENFLSKDYDFYTNNLTGALGAQAARLRDAFNLYGELVTLQIPKQVTIVVTGVIVIAWQAPLLALITLIAIFFVLSYTLVSSSWRLQFRRRVSEASSEVAGQIGDALLHGATVKSFAQEPFEEHRLQKPLNKWASEQYRSWLLYVPADGGRMLLAAVSTAVLLVFSAHLYAAGKITITIVVLVQLYVIKLVASTFDIAEIVKRYEEVMGAAYEPVKTMLVPATIADPVKPKRILGASAYSLELHAVSYQYPDAATTQWAVKDFSFEIQAGQKIGLVGYSGSGKSTLTKLLLRFMDVSEGQITINGTDIRELRQAELRTIISYVPQEPLLFHRSISENIAYAKPNAGAAAIEQAAALAYVDEFAASLPHGYDTLVGERGVKLSGGQRQRVAIARALLKDSPILVLDEATSALDSKSEKYIQDALWKLMKHRTALVIAHRLSTIQRMDMIIVMDKGRIVQVGSHEVLRGRPGIYADLWEHQSGGYIGAPAIVP